MVKVMLYDIIMRYFLFIFMTVVYNINVASKITVNIVIVNAVCVLEASWRRSCNYYDFTVGTITVIAIIIWWRL